MQCVHFIIYVQQMHNYPFTLLIYSTLRSLYILLYLYNKCTFTCLFCQYIVHCAVCTFYYICPTSAPLSIQSNCQYTVQCAVCTFIISVQEMHNYLFTQTVNIHYTVQFVHLLYLSNKCTIIC